MILIFKVYMRKKKKKNETEYKKKKEKKGAKIRNE